MSNTQTVAEYAKEQGISQQAVYQQIKKGKLKTITQRQNGKKVTLIVGLNPVELNFKTSEIKPAVESVESEKTAENSQKQKKVVELNQVELLELLLKEKDERIREKDEQIKRLTEQAETLMKQQAQTLEALQAAQQHTRAMISANNIIEPAPAPGEGKGLKAWWYRFTHTTAPQVKSDAE